MPENVGSVIQITGPAVDVQFAEALMPPIYQALRVVSEGFTVPASIDATKAGPAASTAPKSDGTKIEGAKPKATARPVIAPPRRVIFATPRIQRCEKAAHASSRKLTNPC